MKIVIRLIQRFCSFLSCEYYKIFWKSRVKIVGVWNTIGKIELYVHNKNGKILIGNGFRSYGPVYMSSVDSGILSVGNSTFFNHNCSITAADRISIGDNCYFANNVVIVDHNHKYGLAGITDDLEKSPVSIGDNVWVGANSTILAGVNVGTGTIIGAGAVVTHDIPSHSLAIGVPAEVKKTL